MTPKSSTQMSQARAARKAIAEHFLIQDSAKASSSKKGSWCRTCKSRPIRLLGGYKAQSKHRSWHWRQKSKAKQHKTMAADVGCAMQLLDELYCLLEKDDVNTTEFGELLNLMLRFYRVG